jgi:hypothetical protein
MIKSVNHATSGVKGVILVIGNYRTFIPVNTFKMADNSVTGRIDSTTEDDTSISYEQGYPLYPFFKKIYDEYVREMNASADHLLECINAENRESHDTGINVYEVFSPSGR